MQVTNYCFNLNDLDPKITNHFKDKRKKLMLKLFWSSIFTICSFHLSFGQNTQKIYARLNSLQNSINIQQEIVFHNNSNDTLNTLYLNDWNNAYSNKNTPLAKRFAENFNKSLHFAKNEDKGSTQILSVTDNNFKSLQWSRPKSSDLIKLQLNHPIYPGKNYKFSLTYIVKLPNAKFTDYGFTNNRDFNLRYWYLTPCVYDGNWKLSSNKNLDDLYSLKTTYDVQFTYASGYHIITDLDEINKETGNGVTTINLHGDNRSDLKLIFQKSSNAFSHFTNNKLTLITDLEAKNLNDITKASSANQVVNFVTSHLGDYPNEKLVVTALEYNKNPLYGLNQLPSFIRPFKEEFQYELKLLKTLLHNYLENTLTINPREEQWVLDGIQTYLMMKYVDEYYPNMKLIGNLSDTWLLRSYHLANMSFNEQYPFLYMLMVRKNLNQALTTPNDSLIRFNLKIANKYKAGVGLTYLKNYLGTDAVDEVIQEFYNNCQTIMATQENFEALLKEKAQKDIDWFFTDFVDSERHIDFKIKRVKKIKDSITLSVKNKTGTKVPISLYGINKNDSVVSKLWLTDIRDEKKVTIANTGIDKLVLNYDKVIPEFNQRNNWKSTGGFLSSNKKLKFQFFKDAENPYYKQVFFVPIATYNLYDGFTPGLRLYNKTFLNQPFIYDIRPSYALKEKALVGGGSFLYKNYIQNSNMYVVNYGLGGSSYHYAPDLRYSTITPLVSFGFRPDDLRSNERESLMLRFVNVIRDKDPSIQTNPDYSVFNVRYNYRNIGAINHLTWFVDGQVAKNFSKVSLNIDYRKLFQNNLQLNLRFFAGKFIYNDTTSDYFSFALDRPTDYLFDYNYLGRSEDTGLFSQQLVIAEGGFKSQLDNPYANNWIMTTNASVNIWRWIEAYGDLGLVKNRNIPTRFVYDSGIRLNLVPDYFELYFPVYSNNGWEIADNRYDQKIRFIVTLSPRTLIGLFTRKWF